MKQLTLSILLLLISINIKADKCTVQKAAFEKEEQAYDTVSRIAIAGHKSYEIIGKFVKEGTALLVECPKTYSLDRQYTLKRKITKARKHQQSYHIFSQSQVSSYARSHPEEVIIYKWGTIRSVP